MRWRVWMLALATLVAALAATVVAIAVNVATGGEAPWFPALATHPLWWTAGATTFAAATGFTAWWAQRQLESDSARLVPAEQRPEPWVVDRPAEVDQIVAGLRRRSGATVGVSTALHGAGGFGKTTAAKLVRSDPRILRRFGDLVYWVSLGRDARPSVLTDKVNDLIRWIDPDRPVTFTDAHQAGQYLAGLLKAGPPRLIILDDVWFAEQIDVFPLGGRSARLITTRNVSLVAGHSTPVKVDQLSFAQARAVLMTDLPALPSAVVHGLLDETGRWPLLLRLINRVLVDQRRLYVDLETPTRQLLDRLRQDGVLQVDQLTGATGRQLDVNDPRQRQQAVTATIEASTGLLGPLERDRFAELAVFAQDESVPVSLVSELWHATGGVDQMTTRTLCARLEDLALVSLTPTADGGVVSLHDVVRDYLRKGLGEPHLVTLHSLLLRTVAASVSVAAPGRFSMDDNYTAAWWGLPADARYLWDHTVEHLLAAGRTDEAAMLATDLRWVAARLEQAGPLAPFSDLNRIDTARATVLRRLLGQTAHLLARTEPAHARIDILRSRVAHDPAWGPLLDGSPAERSRPALINRWALPDLPDPALRRTLTGHTLAVKAVAIAPDGTWLATAGSDRSVRIWDAATGAQLAKLTGHTDRVSTVAIAPDGTWLVTGGFDRSLRIWDVDTGNQRVRLSGHARRVNAVAVAPDGSWIASAGDDNSVRIWDAVTGDQRSKLTGHTHRVTAVAIAPDGSWLVTASDDRTARTWDVATGRQIGLRAMYTDWARAVAIAPDGSWLAIAGWSVRIWHLAAERQDTILIREDPDLVNSVAIAPDGSWLSTAGDDRSVRIWDPATKEQPVTLIGHNDPVNAVVIAPDGKWLATASTDQSARIWDAPAPAEVRQTRPASGLSSVTPEAADHHRSGKHSSWLYAVAVAPDGSWLATGSAEQSVQTWDAHTGDLHTSSAVHAGRVNAVAIAPDGTWLATAGWSVRIWSKETGEKVTEIFGHLGRVFALAISPDGGWLVTAGDDRTVRIWNAATGAQLAKLTGHTDRVNAVAIAPDGSWVATAGDDRTVRLWDLTTGTQRAELTGHTDRVNAVAIAPDSSWVATAGDDRTVRIWDPRTGSQRGELTGHQDRVNALAITPDGKWLATAGSDRSVRIWNPATAHASAMMRLEQAAYACAWAPAGQSLFVGGAGGLYHFGLES